MTKSTNSSGFSRFAERQSKSKAEQARELDRICSYPESLLLYSMAVLISYGAIWMCVFPKRPLDDSIGGGGTGIYAVYDEISGVDVVYSSEVHDYSSTGLGMFVCGMLIIVAIGGPAVMIRKAINPDATITAKYKPICVAMFSIAVVGVLLSAGLVVWPHILLKYGVYFPVG